MFPGKNSLTKRIPAGLSSARAQQERVRRSFPIFHPSAKTHFFKGFNVFKVRENPHRVEGSSTEFRTELIPQLLWLGSYLPGIPTLASQITLTITIPKQPILGVFPHCALIHIPGEKSFPEKLQNCFPDLP